VSPDPPSGPAVVVMAHAARSGQARRALEPLLGPDGCADLQAALIVAAVEWGQTVALGEVHVAYEPAGAADEIRALLPPDTPAFPQHGDSVGRRLEDATTRMFARHRRPVLVVWPELPRLRPEHATAALDDLSAGCDLTLGPIIDGGFYLIAIDRPQPSLFALPEEAWREPDVMGIALAAAREAGLEVGLLRSERGLHRPADLRAAQADPTLPPELARILGSRAA
jgi:glycosyltransferase A (GT-A) superfamily protein (DUF2064 family)